MPVYDYRCNSCGREVSLFYKTYKDYDAATPACPHCGSSDLERMITNVALQTGSRNYTGMTSGDMLSVLEGGNHHEVNELFRQSGQDAASTVQQAEVIKDAKDSAANSSKPATSSE
ncbi:MAG: zinc ribbon domain-containing protein [Anaerolineae bacterium]|nr:zinc ribbon domain-containing protein [Anaerolineae bacterium]